MSSSLLRQQRGFTLIELLLVIGIIGILATIVIAAVSPTRQINSAKDADRNMNANTLRKGFEQAIIDGVTFANWGDIPTGTSNAAWICTQGTSDASCVNIDELVDNNFIVSFPVDESSPAEHIGYKVYKNQLGMIGISPGYLSTATASSNSSSAGGGSPPVYASISANSITTGTDITVTVPSGTTEDDLLIAFMATEYASDAYTAPAGWTLLDQTTYTSWLKAAVYYKIAGGAEPSDYTFSGTSSTSDKAVTILRYTGVDIASPIHANETSSGALGAYVHQYDIPSITTSIDNTVLLRMTMVNDDGDNGTFDTGTLPANHTLRQENSTNQMGSMVLEHDDMTTAGSSGTAQINTESLDGGAVDFHISFNVALKPE